MKHISIENSMADSFSQFLNEKGIDLAVVTDKSGDLAVVRCDDRRESNVHIIYAGGWIACATAHAIAKKMGISLRQMGEVLNHLDVKIRQCSLGCFK